MLVLRQIDYYCQYGLGIIMLLSLPVLFVYGFLAGLFIMGCWQLFSASANTSAFLLHGLYREIGNYWKFTGCIMALIFLCFPLATFIDPDDVQVLGVVATLLSIPLAFYYLVIYKKLIDHFLLRKEVSGLIKSKH